MVLHIILHMGPYKSYSDISIVLRDKVVSLLFRCRIVLNIMIYVKVSTNIPLTMVLRSLSVDIVEPFGLNHTVNESAGKPSAGVIRQNEGRREGLALQDLFGLGMAGGLSIRFTVSLISFRGLWKKVINMHRRINNEHTS